MYLIQVKTEPSTHGETNLEVQTPKRSEMNEKNNIPLEQRNLNKLQ